MSRMVDARPSGTSGFTLVELLVAIMVFSLGAAGMAGVTMVLVRESTLAGMKTRRTAAATAAVEQLRALPYDSLRAGSDSLMGYHTYWTPMLSPSGDAQIITLVTVGPGFRSTSGGPPMATADVPDTFVYRILEP
ncbi:MAG: prepilin-type N-terminal cleavage/methylation domain-containing protein [Gemmatimonadota bacterium]